MTFGLSKLDLDEEEALIEAFEKGKKMSDENTTATNEPFTQDAATTAINEEPHVTAVIEDKLKNGDKPVTPTMIVDTLKRIEHALRKDYPDEDRIVVPVANLHTVIHHDFRRKVQPIPHWIAFPRPALVNGKPIQDGKVTIPAVHDEDGVLIKPSYDLPVYVAADEDGNPLRDSRNEYVVIDPQNGRIRQRVKPRALAVRKKSWLRLRWMAFFRWMKSFRFDFKIIKRR